MANKMTYEEVSAAIDALDGRMADIRHAFDPDRLFFAYVGYCEEDSEGAFVDLLWADRGSLTVWAETLCEVRVENILSITPSEHTEESITVSNDDPEPIMNEPNIWPQFRQPDSEG
jgi:hypothetical protein